MEHPLNTTHHLSPQNEVSSPFVQRHGIYDPRIEIFTPVSMAAIGEEESSIPLLVSDSRQSYELDELHRQDNGQFLGSGVSSSSTLLDDIDLEDQQKDENDTLTRLPNIDTTLSLPSNPRTSTSFLDGLRGLAALFVFLQHSNPCNQDLSKRGFGQDGSWEITSFPVLRLLFVS